jgi:hypothetical protein
MTLGAVPFVINIITELVLSRYTSGCNIRSVSASVQRINQHPNYVFAIPWTLSLNSVSMHVQKFVHTCLHVCWET